MTQKRMFCLVLAVFFIAPISVFGASFDTLVVFGDSLSDNGNLYAADPLSVPSAYYWEGRVSNGPVWVEYLAGDLLNCALVDNAYAGAETSGEVPPGLLQQVNLYAATADLPHNALFVVWIGANDILSESGVTEESLADSISNIGTALQKLADFGAEDILILNLPNMGSLPLSLDSQTTGLFLKAASISFNSSLSDTVDHFAGDNPGIAVYKLDIYSLFERILANPASFGFTNVTDVLLDPAKPYNFDNTEGYVFWDDIHPTTEAHVEIAEQAYELLNSGSDNSGGYGDDGDDDGGCFISTVSDFN